MLGFTGLTLGEHSKVFAQPDLIRRRGIPLRRKILHGLQTADVIHQAQLANLYNCRTSG